MKLKKILCSGLSLLMLLNSSIVANASTNEKKLNVVTIYEKNCNQNQAADVDNQEVPERIIVSEEHAKSNSNPKLRYGESEKPKIIKTEYKSTTVTPSGQSAGGYRFSTGGGFYVNTSGGTTATVSFGLTWGVVNVGVSVGYASKNNIGGVYVSAPNRTNYFKVKMTKKYKFDRVLVDCYQYNVYKYSYYTTWKSLYSTNVYCVKV